MMKSLGTVAAIALTALLFTVPALTGCDTNGSSTDPHSEEVVADMVEKQFDLVGHAMDKMDLEAGYEGSDPWEGFSATYTIEENLLTVEIMLTDFTPPETPENFTINGDITVEISGTFNDNWEFETMTVTSEQESQNHPEGIRLLVMNAELTWEGGTPVGEGNPPGDPDSITGTIELDGRSYRLEDLDIEFGGGEEE